MFVFSVEGLDEELNDNRKMQLEMQLDKRNDELPKK